jgi:tetratricopeptide (TPR) repeat protein
MFLGGGAMAAAGMVWWQGIGFLGVGLPFGMILGLIFYLTLIALVPQLQPQRSSVQGARIYLLIGLLSAVMAHFVEIHFGIAIVVTQTYFWVFTGLMLIVGMGLSGDTSLGETTDRALERKELAARGSGRGTVRRRRARRKSRAVSTAARRGSLWGSSVLWGGGALALLIATLGFDFLSNPMQMTRAGSIIWYSLTRLPREGEPVSWGVFALVMITWLGGGVLVWVEHRRGEDSVLRHLPELWLLSAGLAALYWFWHAGSLAASTRLAISGQMDLMDHLEGFLRLLRNYYLFLIALVALGGAVLVAEWPQRVASRPMLSAFLSLVVLGGMVFLLQRLSLRPIQADMAFKLGEPFAQSRRWSLVISLYQRATQLAPMEDHYYLFKGRAYLDQARAAQSKEETEAWMLQAEDSLKRALRLNPLNPDHTANLARLFTVWSSITRNDDELRRARARLAEEYYRRTLRLSPNNVGLWVELGSLYLNQMQNPEAALKVLTQAIQVDEQYDRAHAVMGEYYLQQSRSKEGRDRTEVLEKAAERFQMALDLASENARQDRFSYTVNLGAVYAEMGDLAQSIAAYEQALEILPTANDAWRVEEALAGLYGQSGQWDKALLHARAAWQLAPEEQKPRLEAMIETILELLPDE